MHIYTSSAVVIYPWTPEYRPFAVSIRLIHECYTQLCLNGQDRGVLIYSIASHPQQHEWMPKFIQGKKPTYKLSEIVLGSTRFLLGRQERAVYLQRAVQRRGTSILHP